MPANLSALEALDRLRAGNLRFASKVISIEATLEAVARAATRIDVRMAVDHLRHGTPAIERLVTREGMMVIGSEYDLESGRVEFIG
jgi:hypothetical protein